jgi:hypothetical protein
MRSEPPIEAADWKHARSLVVDAIDRPGSFLDLGCANGYLVESVLRALEEQVASCGHEIPGRSERAHRDTRVVYRAFRIAFE